MLIYTNNKLNSRVILISNMNKNNIINLPYNYCIDDYSHKKIEPKVMNSKMVLVLLRLPWLLAAMLSDKKNSIT